MHSTVNFIKKTSIGKHTFLALQSSNWKHLTVISINKKFIVFQFHRFRPVIISKIIPIIIPIIVPKIVPKLSQKLSQKLSLNLTVLTFILLTSSKNQIYELRIPNIYNYFFNNIQLMYTLCFLVASVKLKVYKKVVKFSLKQQEILGIRNS